MSYEGYVQVLCEDGHMNIYDYFDESYGHDLLCEDIGCLKKQVFWNHVNETNGDNPETGQGYGYVAFEIAHTSINETCNLGHNHVISETRYVIPTKR